MEIKGICRITNKFDTKGNILRSEYQFELKKTKLDEEYAIGRLSYSSAKKINGKYQNTYISKTFSCFHPATINFLKNTLGNSIEITGQLKIESYIDKNNKSQTIEKILITDAYLLDKENENKSSKNSVIGENIKPEEEVSDFDNIPF